jgi:hypothetical protein
LKRKLQKDFRLVCDHKLGIGGLPVWITMSL